MLLKLWPSLAAAKAAESAAAECRSAQRCGRSAALQLDCPQVQTRSPSPCCSGRSVSRTLCMCKSDTSCSADSCAPLQVFLRTPGPPSNGKSRGPALVYAASWWNAEHVGRFLRDKVRCSPIAL